MFGCQTRVQEVKDAQKEVSGLVKDVREGEGFCDEDKSEGEKD